MIKKTHLLISFSKFIFLTFLQWSQIANVAMRFLEKVQNIFLLISILICACLNDDNLPTAYSQ